MSTASAGDYLICADRRYNKGGLESRPFFSTPGNNIVNIYDIDVSDKAVRRVL